MDRRRSLLKIAALRTEREHQQGVDCSQGYLQSPAAGLLAEGPRTLECLFKYAPSDKMQMIAGFGSSMMEVDVMSSANQIRFYCGGTFATAAIVLGNNYLAHISYDGTTAICYLNGTEAARFTVTGYKVADLFRTGSPSYAPKGSLVFCRHYNYALSAEEIAALYNNGDPAGYVLPGTYKGEGNSHESNFSTSSERWTPLDGAVLTYDEINHVVELNSGNNRNANMYSPVTYDTIKAHIYNIEVIIDKNTAVSRCQFFPYVSNEYISLIAEDNDDITIFKGVYIPSDRYLFSNNLYCYFALSTPTTVRVRSIRVTPVGCIAEYLPQNLIGQRDENPFDMSGATTYTWTGETDSIYSRSVLLGKMCESGTTVSVKGTVSNYQSGAPFIYVGETRVDIPAKDGDFTVMVAGSKAFDRVSYYGGLNGTDRRLTITINSVELVPDVALSWLDSAKQLPLNDEYLPPMLQSDGGYDLTASGMPEIIIK